MKFGIYLDVSVARPFAAETERQSFELAIAQAVLADSLGFDYCWVPEHHFLEEYSHSSAPEVLLAAIGAKTGHIRLGASVLASHSVHPSAIAERSAALDLLSDGRVDLAIARPATVAEQSAHCRNGQHAPDVWEECVRAISQMWVHEYCAWNGRHFAMAERAVLPKPCQKPHPPLWAAPSDSVGEEEAGALGLGLLTCAVADAGEQAQRIAAYRNRLAAGEPAGAFANNQVAVTDLLYCHEGSAEATETGARLLGAARGLSARPVSGREVGLRGAPDTYAGLAVGDPKTIIDAVRGWESMGVDCVNFRLGSGEAVAPAEIEASLRLFATEVMPVFRRQKTRAAAE